MSGRRGRPENFLPVRTNEEARERGHNGGVKSGESRRAKKQLRELARMFLDMKPTESISANLSKLGIQENDQTNMMAMLASLYTEVMRGNVNAFRTYMEYAGLAPNQELRDLELEDRIRTIELRPTEESLAESSDDNDVVIYLPDNGRGDADGSFKPDSNATTLDNKAN